MAFQRSAKGNQTKLRKVAFRTKAEGAREVVVTGDFTKWATDRIRLTYAGDGEWQTELNLAPGEYQYRLVIDGQWRDDPTSTRRVPNAFGTENSILTVS